MSQVQIAPVTAADGPDLIAANQRSRDHHRPWVEPFTDGRGFEEWYGATNTETQVSLVARNRAGGGVVGVLNLSQIFRKAFQSAYLGFYGAVDFAGQGLMTEAVRLTATFAFADLGLHRIEANIQPGNVRSLALVRRVGFRKEGYSPRYLRIGGEWRDHERWALLADESDVGGSLNVAF
jgi:ribosomal-protein-alanine N-acetyltransferase